MPPRRGLAAEIPLSDSEPESMRGFWGRDVEDDNDGVGTGLSKPDESTWGMVGRV